MNGRALSCSYYSPVFEDALDVVQIECADAHEAESLEKSHVHILSLVIVDCLVVGILPDHRHLTLRHQILHTLVNFPDH